MLFFNREQSRYFKWQSMLHVSRREEFNIYIGVCERRWEFQTFDGIFHAERISGKWYRICCGGRVDFARKAIDMQWIGAALVGHD